MQRKILFVLGLLGLSGGQHVLPIEMIHHENPYNVLIPNAAAKDPHFIRGVMQLQEVSSRPGECVQFYCGSIALNQCSIEQIQL